LSDPSGLEGVVEIETGNGRVDDVETGVGFGDVDLETETVEGVDKEAFFNLFLLQISQMKFYAVFPDVVYRRVGLMFFFKILGNAKHQS